MPAQVYSAELGMENVLLHFMETMKISQTNVEKVFHNETIIKHVLFHYGTTSSRICNLFMTNRG